MKDLIIWCGSEDTFKAYHSFLEYCGDVKYLENRIKVNDDIDDDDEYAIGGSMVQFKDDVAIVKISGTLVPAYSFWNKYLGLVSYDEIKSAISHSVELGAKKIILNIDSGGGAVVGLDECANYIKAVSDNVVPIYSHTSTICASGAYWIAAATKEISGAPMAVSGSIGVIAVHLSYADRLTEAGIEATIFRAGEFKALGHPYEKLDKKAHDEIQGRINQTYAFFLNHVNSNRPVQINRKDSWAEGKVFITEDAISQKLLDNKTYLNQFIEKIRLTNNNRTLSINVAENANTQGSDEMAKTVKSPEELAALAHGAQIDVSEEAQEEQVEETVDSQVEETESSDEDTTEVSEPEVTEEVEETNVQNNASGIDPVVYADVLVEKALLEKENESVKAQLEQANSDSAALQKIAVEAVNRLQIALNESPTDLSKVSASTVLEMYADKSEKFNKTFKVGVSSSQVVEATNENLAEGSGIFPIN